MYIYCQYKNKDQVILMTIKLANRADISAVDMIHTQEYKSENILIRRQNTGIICFFSLKQSSHLVWMLVVHLIIALFFLNTRQCNVWITQICYFVTLNMLFKAVNVIHERSLSIIKLDLTKEKCQVSWKYGICFFTQ